MPVFAIVQLFLFLPHSYPMLQSGDFFPSNRLASCRLNVWALNALQYSSVTQWRYGSMGCAFDVHLCTRRHARCIHSIEKYDWRGPDDLIIVPSLLSRSHHYDRAHRVDECTSFILLWKTNVDLCLPSITQCSHSAVLETRRSENIKHPTVKGDL